MKILRSNLFLLTALSLLLSQTACKSKKAIVSPAAPVVTDTKPVPQEQPKEAPAQVKQEEPKAPVLNFNFANIQFEFNSVVLRTGSYEVLESASKVMKQVPETKFILNGHSSEEGSTKHNMNLSVDRANAVKTYLTNAGIDVDRLVIKGWGETKPVASNTNEEGRALNRRVEIKLVK